MFVYGGVMMLISAGNRESFKAKGILTAVIGLVIVFASYLIAILPKVDILIVGVVYHQHLHQQLIKPLLSFYEFFCKKKGIFRSRFYR